MTINNRGLQGQPGLPYIDNRLYAGSTAVLNFTILDINGVAAPPVQFTYQVDDMTNAQNMVPSTSIGAQAFQFTVTLPASAMVMTHDWQGSQICQISSTATLADGSTVKGITVIELVSIQTPFGAG